MRASQKRTHIDLAAIVEPIAEWSSDAVDDQAFPESDIIDLPYK